MIFVCSECDEILCEHSECEHYPLGSEKRRKHESKLEYMCDMYCPQEEEKLK